MILVCQLSLIIRMNNSWIYHLKKKKRSEELISKISILRSMMINELKRVLKYKKYELISMIEGDGQNANSLEFTSHENKIYYR